MLKMLFTKNNLSFSDKKVFRRNVLNLCSQLSIKSSTNHRITEFESLINSEKVKAKNYLLIEDKCNTFSKLNTESVSLLLETKVSKVLKWTFNDKNCALIEINDNNYTIRRDIRRNFEIETKNKKSFINHLRYIPLNTCPKVLDSSFFRNKKMDFVQQLSSRKKDNLYLNVNYLRESFKSNEDLLKYLLLEKDVSDLDLKIRFYIICQLERLLCQSFFKDYQILPFGSSIAGLGTPSSDLDLVLIARQLAEDSDSKYEDRKRLQSSLNLVADLLESSVPLYSHFSRILKARIPIIKFGFDLAPVDIDLSIECSPYSVHHGVYMSAYLHYCIQLNPVFRDLIILLRTWAKQHKLVKPKNWSTNNIIYNGFTSFQLTSLVIFYLQSKGLVPPMKQFLSSTQPFIAPKRQLDSIQMLKDFFEFVLCLRYDWEGISILNANTFPNPDSSVVYMENPFDTERNMCRNISNKRLERFLEITNVCLNTMRSPGFSLAEIFNSESSHRDRTRIRVDDLFSDS